MTVSPLRPLVYHLLVVLGEGPSHGYALMQEVNRSAGRHRLLGPGTLYRTLKELRDLGWIEEASSPDSESDDRRRYYRLTELGRSVATEETRRLGSLVDAARRAGLDGRARA